MNVLNREKEKMRRQRDEREWEWGWLTKLRQKTGVGVGVPGMLQDKDNLISVTGHKWVTFLSFVIFFNDIFPIFLQIYPRTWNYYYFFPFSYVMLLISNIVTTKA